MKPVSALRIVQNVFAELALNYPSALITATDTDTIQALSLLYSISRELRNLRCFPTQKKRYEFTLAGSNRLNLPVDYYSPILSTHLNHNTSRRLNGPVPDYDFTVMSNLGIQQSNEYSYRIFGPFSNHYMTTGQFELYPAPPSSPDSVTYSFEYISSNLFYPALWLPSTAYTSGQYVFSEGNIYKCDTSGTSDSFFPPSGTSQNISDGTTRWDYQNMSYEAIIADTDISVFDGDIMIAGLKAKYLAHRSLPLAEKAEAEYQRLLSRAKGRLEGSFVGSFSRQRISRRYQPETPGGWSI